MAHDQLWAPWRLQYIVTHKDQPETDCFICRGAAGADDRANLVVQRTPVGIVVLNRYPYNNGHLLVAPRRHVGAMAELSDDEMLDGARTVRDMMGVLDELMKPDGYNVGLNLGRVAGAGLPGHLHWHVVPRWNGDTNFMPVISDTRVIAQSLRSLYDLLTERLARGRGSSPPRPGACRDENHKE